MLLLNNAGVARVLDMRLCLDALDDMFHEIARGDAAGMGRVDVNIPSGEQSPYYRWAVMAGGSRGTGYLCARMMSDVVAWPIEHGHQRENKLAGQPGTFCGLLFLYRVSDGLPVAMIQDGYLQHIRVGGGAGLGAKYLSREDRQVVPTVRSSASSTYLLTRVQGSSGGRGRNTFRSRSQTCPAAAPHPEARAGGTKGRWRAR